jgi:hypothetical protein
MLRDVGCLLLGRCRPVSSASIAPSVSSGHSAKLRLALLHHLAAGGVDQLGQALPAEVGRVLQALPAAFGELAKASLKPGVVRHHAVFEARRVAVAFQFSGATTLLGEAWRTPPAPPRRCRGRRPRSPAARATASMPASSLHDEQHVLDGGAVAHGAVSA